MKAKVWTITAACLLLAGTAFGYEVVPVENGGAVKGVVTTKASATNSATIETTKDTEVCHATVPDESVLVGENGGLADAIVYFESVESGKDPAGMPEAVLHNHGCRYEPHVLAMMAGQSLVITNQDPILHNTHSYDAADKTVFNLALPIQGQKIKKKMKKPGLVSVKCDAGHTWMNGYIYVGENPYYAVTDKDGNFEIDDIPPGDYKVKIWHPHLGESEQDVTITAGKTAELKVSLGG